MILGQGQSRVRRDDAVGLMSRPPVAALMGAWTGVRRRGRGFGLALLDHAEPCTCRVCGQDRTEVQDGHRTSRTARRVLPCEVGGPRAITAVVMPKQRMTRASMATDGTETAEKRTTSTTQEAAVEAGPEDHVEWMHAIADERSRAAFARLFAHFAPRIKAYLMRSGSDEPAAEELVQEAMMTVWRRAESFDRNQASVATWMFTIARNKRIDAYRRSNRPTLDPNDPALVPQAEAMQDDSVGADETARAIQDAIAGLPEEQAEMLRLAFFEDLAHSEIAERTGLPLGTVKSRLRLAIGKMRGLVDEELR